ncbi:MAG: hypothetical protein ACKVTZ_17580 [Bacteroidia bacterium]
MQKNVQFILLFASILSFSACKKQAIRQEAQPAAIPIPAALEDNKRKLSSYGRKEGYDLVEDLYQELLKTSPDLQQIEEELEKVAKEKSETETQCTQFLNKSINYYSVANQNISSIKDSTLKKKMLATIAGSEFNHKKQTLELTQLLQKMDTNVYSLRDYHTVLKITKTLPLIETYQKSKLPDNKGAKAVIQHQEELMKKMGK